jgi:hypothetical protein
MAIPLLDLLNHFNALQCAMLRTVELHFALHSEDMPPKSRLIYSDMDLTLQPCLIESQIRIQIL